MERTVENKFIEIEPKMAKSADKEELSGVTMVIIIGGGVLTFIILFIFAKRQIMRFTLRSRRGPHVPIGHDARKNMKKEIERRIDAIEKISHEPQLILDDHRYILRPDCPLPPFYYRLKAVDDVKVLEREIARQDGSVRQPRENLRAFLLTTLAAALNGSGQRLIHQFCDMYEHARHDPSEFGNEEYEAYHRMLMKLIDAAKSMKNFCNSRKSSPSRTPVKKQQTKMQSLLDPSRLRPPPLLSESNARINLSLGVQLQQQQLDQIGDLGENEILAVPHFHDEAKA
ncbi:protein C1orf43 homolog [Phlebotomus argentipes]|uniref:protein C1orf43 homolog n=1 Tax=Phlebotomus argentipes TaxID=94469 RepID=UPI0028937690|nr:protein C1orf43 homolog [Phlebotomus argentipes]